MNRNSLIQEAIERQSTDVWQDLSNYMTQALLASTFSNRLLIKPRRLQEIAETETEAFVAYVEGTSEIQAETRGKTLAHDGLGQESILALSTSIRSLYHKMHGGLPYIQNDLFDLVEIYCNALLGGYMTGREIEISKEQERTHEAYIRILENNR